jgi:hypothetical protein
VLSSALALFGELDRAQHVGRLVDEIAGENHAFRDGVGHVVGLLGGTRGSGNDRHLGSLAVLGVVVFALLRLVDIEAIGAELHAEREIGGILRRDGGARRIEVDRRLVGAADLAGGGTAGLQPVVRDELFRLAEAENQDTIDGCAVRRQHVEGLQCLAGEFRHAPRRG